MGCKPGSQEIEVRFSAKVRDFSLICSIHIRYEAHAASHPTITGDTFPEIEADHSPPNSAEVKNMWIYTSTFKVSSKVSSWCSA
jgi:hypothetical protein